MEKHVTIVAIINLAFGCIKLLLGFIFFFIIAGAGLISGEVTAIAVTSTVAAVIAGILMVLAVPEIIAAFGLLKYRPWARILTLIIAVFDLLQVPIGTLIGIYELWVMLDDRTVDLFYPNKKSGA